MNYLPKVELHCHLDGSVRPETVLEIALKDGIPLPQTELVAVTDLLIAPTDCPSLAVYLERFSLPVSIMQTKESLRRITYELFEDASKEQVTYMEVRFGPQLHTQKGLSLSEIIESVLLGMKQAEKTYPIKGNIILGCLRSMTVEQAFEVVEAGRPYLNQGVVAIDLCAIEELGFVETFEAPINLARQYGYNVTIHAGETGHSINVIQSIERLGAQRIGHGVAIAQDSVAYQQVKERGIVLEMCPTSNIQTKAVSEMSEHPLVTFLRDGIKVTINTDNRTVSNTTMTNELIQLGEQCYLTQAEYAKIYKMSVDASFATQDVKEWCLTQFESNINIK